MRRGFTIIETTVVLCLISILAAIAIPGFGRVIDAIEVRQATVEAETLFAAARHLAISRASQTTVDIDTAKKIVTVRIGGDTLRKRELGKDHRVELHSSRASMSYSAIGVGYGAANLTLIIKRNASLDSVIVSRLGRVRH